MAAKSQHGRARYRKGCRCDQCKRAESEYQKARRQRIAESVGEFAGNGRRLALVSGAENSPLTCGNMPTHSANPANIAGPVEIGVLAEIEGLGEHKRPALAAAALSLAEVLDNPKATSTKPAAAAKLADILDTLRRRADGSKPKLAAVRQMTKKRT